MHLSTIGTVRLISLISVVIAMSSEVHAFDINGFRSYMKEDEALRSLQRRFDHVASVQQSVSRRTAYLGTSSTSSEAESIILCDGRLTSYSSDVRGGFKAFVRLVERESVLRGFGQYSALSNETSAGSWNIIRFVWRVGEDTKEIFMSQVGSQSSQVSVNYVSRSTCPEP